MIFFVSTSLETRGFDATGVSGILIIRGGLGTGKVVRDLRYAIFKV